MKPTDLILGIDGGGSKTVAWLASRDDPSERGVLGRGTSGGANVRTMGLEAATANLQQAVNAAFTDAGISPACVSNACLGLAGAGRAEEQASLRAWATDRLATRVLVTNDAIPVLRAGTPDGCGIALIAGTGSLAYGQDASGENARCGGWGPLLGDEGSGYAISLAGLRAAIRWHEDRGPRTCLLDRFLTAFEIDDPRQLIRLVHESTSREIARHAPVVFQASHDGDLVASQLVTSAANDLAGLVQPLAERLAFGNQPIPLAYTGGVLVNEPTFRQRVRDTICAEVRCSPIQTVAHPVVGALLLASELQ